MPETGNTHERMSPPTRENVAGRIVSDVCGRIEFDREPVRERLRDGLREPDDEYIWPRAERIAGDALREFWVDRLEEQCRVGLEHARETALAQAMGCLDARDELGARGRDSWIAQAVIHTFAFDVAAEVFETNPEFGVESFPLDDGQGVEREE
jgi:hypothetical protein